MKQVRSWAALYLTGAAVGTLLLCRSAFFYFEPTLLLNLSSSLPKGVYRVTPIKTLTLGEIVAFKPPRRVYRTLGKRLWLNEKHLFIKPVGALSGDKVCQIKNYIVINRTQRLRIAKSDSQGQKLPTLTGCMTVPALFFLPISTYSVNSFDGRYFGPIHRDTIVGKATPVFTW